MGYSPPHQRMKRKASDKPNAEEKRHMDRVSQMPCSDRYWSKVCRGQQNECWPWQATRQAKGYGQFWWNGKYRPATHISLLLDGRERPSDELYALHSCDNPRCVNPRHLRWGTPQENMDDRTVRGRAKTPTGEAHGNAKLTKQAVIAIRADPRPQRIIADEHGIGQEAVSRIKSGKRWGHIQ